MNPRRYMVGIDVGSTTVKCVVIDRQTDRLIWSDYRRHDSKQPEMTLAFLKRIETETPVRRANARAFITGSGGAGMADFTGAKFVQEVNAVCLAVERLDPGAGSVIELGGQDAKIIIFQEDAETGRKRKIPSMNDKCAGGTGSVIDKISAKLCIPPDQLGQMGYHGLKLHPVAGKCGVFAETDINSLQKQGVPATELMASLFEAIVQQNLSVLTRGHTLRPHVLLLGGPNTYVRGMVEAWKWNIPRVWAERELPLPPGEEPAELVRVPANAHLYAAIGAVEYGKTEEEESGCYKGWHELEEYIAVGRSQSKAHRFAAGGLVGSATELAAFERRYCQPPFQSAVASRGERVEVFVGIDGGSTSTKAVLLSREQIVLAKAYQLSRGNPIEDTIEVCASLRRQIEADGGELDVLGVGTTGYAKDMIRDVLAADTAIVETVAHTESALQFFQHVDVVCDVGGQDIKIIILKNRQVKDFRLNTQCSAGNGYFLQATAEEFGFRVEDFAREAFAARAYPEFGYGCAVFMQSDIVDALRKGWEPREIMAGLANVLPKNIWLYVCQIPNLAQLGRNFVLQGGTQYNLAAVKAQVDFIERRFANKGESAPNVRVHPHAGEAGAIGAALEAARLHERGRRSSFIGLDALSRISYSLTRDEATRCNFCKNSCLRTFIDVRTGAAVGADVGAVGGADVGAAGGADREVVPAAITAEARRLIIATCEKGAVEELSAMRQIKAELDEVKRANPNLVAEWAREVFQRQHPASVVDPPTRFPLGRTSRRRRALALRRHALRIGIPRVLNLYSTAPFFSAYFEALGVTQQGIVFSDHTSDELYKAGSKRSSIDPCFPSKVANAHIHDLLTVSHRRRPLDWIFFPMLDCLPTPLGGTIATRACPAVTATPAAVRAAYTKEEDLFARHGVRFLSPILNLSEPELCARQLHQQFAPLMGLGRREHGRAMAEAYRALDRFEARMRRRGREVIDLVRRQNRVAIVVLARPYHTDPGFNHGILELLRKCGYPIIMQDCLPIDPAGLDELFGSEVRAGLLRDPLAIDDVWKNSYSENTNRKLWAAKYVARHPNLVALELSSFKCGHDAPVYTVIEEIIETSGTPYFSFKDLDENRAAGSIKLRIETIDYFLNEHQETLARRNAERGRIEQRLAEYERQLRAGIEPEPIALREVRVPAGTGPEAGTGTVGGGNGTALPLVPNR